MPWRKWKKLEISDEKTDYQTWFECNPFLSLLCRGENQINLISHSRNLHSNWTFFRFFSTFNLKLFAFFNVLILKISQISALGSTLFSWFILTPICMQFTGALKADLGKNKFFIEWSKKNDITLTWNCNRQKKKICLLVKAICR